MTKLKHFKKTNSVKKMAEVLQTEGAFVVDNVLSKEFVKKLRQDTDPKTH